MCCSRFETELSFLGTKNLFCHFLKLIVFISGGWGQGGGDMYRGKLGKMVHSEPQFWPPITNLYGLVPQQRRIFFLIISYKFSILDLQNNLIIDL